MKHGFDGAALPMLLTASVRSQSLQELPEREQRIQIGRHHTILQVDSLVSCTWIGVLDTFPIAVNPTKCDTVGPPRGGV